MDTRKRRRMPSNPNSAEFAEFKSMVSAKVPQKKSSIGILGQKAVLNTANTAILRRSVLGNPRRVTSSIPASERVSSEASGTHPGEETNLRRESADTSG